MRFLVVVLGPKEWHVTEICDDSIVDHALVPCNSSIEM
jgi:hypothetical protein